MHVEALPHLQRARSRTSASGACAPGVVLNPATPLSSLEEILPELDYVLVMSVNPGFGGQKLPPRQPRQGAPAARACIARARPARRRSRWTAASTSGNVRALREAGAEVLVAGSAVFGARGSRGAARGLVEAGR